METEYGLAIKGQQDWDPYFGSLLLLGCCEFCPAPKALWDYQGESPGRDLRGFEVIAHPEPLSPDDNRAINKLLANGGRFYLDHAHPEYATPECTNPRDLVKFEKAGEVLLESSRRRANKCCPDGREILIYKNNSDGKGNSYGCHENYLIGRQVSLKALVEGLVPFLATRQVYAGAGKVGVENKAGQAPYQISQRADFCESVLGINTTTQRPIINTRDEPHSNPEKYIRLHIIIGDSNMSEASTYLKVGTTSIVLGMLQEGALPKGLALQDPVAAIRQFSHDPTCKRAVPLENGKKMTALQIQRQYLEAAQAYMSRSGVRGPKSEGMGDQESPTEDWESDILRRWEHALDCLEEDPVLLSREVDWAMKLALLTSFMEKKGCGWDDHRVRMMALQYHDIRPERGLFFTLEREGLAERILSQQEILEAVERPPLDTRAFFRGAAISRFGASIYGASWTSILFFNADSVARVPMMEPTKGTFRLVADLLSRSQTAEELLRNLAQ